MRCSSQKEKEGTFLYRLFYPKKIVLIFVFLLNVHFIEYTFRIYIILHMKKITSYTFLLIFKIVESLQRILEWFK